MLKVTLKLDPTATVHERKTFGIMALLVDIGGLSFFICLLVTPIMGFLIGNTYYNSLFKQLYWVNDFGANTTQEEKENSDRPHEYAEQWSKQTERFTISRKNSCL